MRTNETSETQTDDIRKLYTEVGRRITEVRRMAGLSHYELAEKLGVPVSYTEILENGILVTADNRRYMRWNECLFTKEELARISRQLSVCIGFNPRARALAPETVFFCPVTINHSAVMKELQSLAECSDLSSYLTKQKVGIFSLKYRLLYRQICVKTDKRNAELMQQKLLSVLDTRKVHL